MTIPPQVRDFFSLQEADSTRISTGWINLTLLVRGTKGERFILQRLASIFSAEVNLDIAAITEHLAEMGLATPRLVPGLNGGLWVEDEQEHIWRMMSWMPGQTLLAADSPGRCHSAAALLGRFHRALWNFDYAFKHRRLGVHDTAKHLAALKTALRRHRDHRHYSAVEEIAQAVLEASTELPLTEHLPTRIVHGDPKISNILFRPTGDAHCLVDLDTVGRMPIAVELGDALRSWCAPSGEDQEGEVNLERYAAALEGYTVAMGDLLTPAERDPIPRAAELITVELAARFCTDALLESYFGWDRERFESASVHNLARARSQLALAGSLKRHRAEIEATLRALAA